jgi:hypothetical protein
MHLVSILGSSVVISARAECGGVSECQDGLRVRCAAPSPPCGPCWDSAGERWESMKEVKEMRASKGFADDRSLKRLSIIDEEHSTRSTLGAAQCPEESVGRKRLYLEQIAPRPSRRVGINVAQLALLRHPDIAVPAGQLCAITPTVVRKGR